MPLGPSPKRKAAQREWRTRVAELPPGERELVRAIEKAYASAGTRRDDLPDLEATIGRLDAGEAAALIYELKELPE